MKNLRSLGEPASSAHLRRTGRDLVDFRTTFSCHTGPGDIHVINISRLGLMARTKAVVSKGERLIIRLPVCGRSEEHTSELQSLMRISYAVFCLKKKNREVIPIQSKRHGRTRKHNLET